MGHLPDPSDRGDAFMFPSGNPLSQLPTSSVVKLPTFLWLSVLLPEEIPTPEKVGG